MSSKARLVVLVLIAGLLTSITGLLPFSALADTSVNLAWTPSPATDITNYTIYYGIASRTYTNSISAGSATNLTVSGLTAGVTYYFAATAVDSWGLESDYSNEAVSPHSSPSISAIPDQTTFQDTPIGPVLFTVEDPATDASNLTLAASSSDTGLVPASNFVFGGSGTNRSVVIVPASGQSGQASITITVNDGPARASTAFVLTVAAQRPPPNTAPSISPIGNLTIAQNGSSPAVPFTVADAQQSAATLTLWAASTNVTLLPTNNILLGGNNNNRTITLTPVPGLTGDSDIVLYVGDGSATSSIAFHVTVQPATSPSALTLLVSGKGNVSPNLGSQKLSMGRQYTVTAMPSPGQMFCGWVGSITSIVQRLSFVMKSNLVLRADFASLNLRMSGAGSLTPDLRTAQNLIMGKSYTITAAPGSGQLFVGWTGMLTSSTPRITFVMSPSVDLQANFIPNPWLAVQGTYSGLFHEEAAVRPTSAGSFTVLVSSNGTYSGSLQLGARRLPLSGHLDLQCQDTRTLALSPSNHLTLSLRLGTGDHTDTVSGTLTDGTWVSMLSGDRAVFNARTKPAPFAGAYTLILPGADGDASMPAGDGYGTVKVTTAGLASFTGTLADGTAVSQSANVSKDGFWPLYLPVYSGQGVLMSWLAFTNLPGSDINGLLSWIKPAISTAQYYAAGFTQECQAVGSAYAQLPKKYALGLPLTNANIAFSEGNLAAGFTNSIAVSTAGLLVNKSKNALTLTVSPLNGTFKGRVTDPATSNSFPFGGAVFQKQTTAYGSLLGTNQSSRVSLVP